jgi:hypothetical protein
MPREIWLVSFAVQPIGEFYLVIHFFSKWHCARLNFVWLAFRRADSVFSDTRPLKGADQSRVLALGDRQKPGKIRKSEELCV